MARKTPPPPALHTSHTMSILVENEPGVLARVVGLFSGRGYNIDTLTVAEIDRGGAMSRISVVTSGSDAVIDQIKAQLERLVPVYAVHDLTTQGPHVQRELALVKVTGTGENRIEALRIADIFRANVVDSTLKSFVFEVTGSSEKIDAFIDLMRPLGVVDISRTGIAAISRGAEGLLEAYRVSDLSAKNPTRMPKSHSGGKHGKASKGKS